MKKVFRFSLIMVISASLLLSGCSKGGDTENKSSLSPSSSESASPENVIATAQPTSTTVIPVPSIDVSKVKPNEAGKVMIVMFHNFVQSFTPSKYDNGEYTTTFDEFRKLLPELYDKGYRLVNLNDYHNNNISVPAGCIPMVFTFDDGTAGQFNLVREGDKLVANKDSAVGIMEEFNKTHSDFGLKGSFYINFGSDTFAGEGTMAERMKYLIDKGFEIGNHTYNHVNLSTMKSAEKVQEEIGANQKTISELVPGYVMTSISLPYGGLPAKDIKSYVEKGEYQGVKYENLIALEVGWDPWFSPVSKNYNPLTTHRVRASGIKPVDADLAWWLKQLSKSEQYISDGNPDTVTVPKDKEEAVDKNKLNNKKLIVY
jgi:hypothetical protein